MATAYERPFHPADLSQRAAAVFSLDQMIDQLRKEEDFLHTNRCSLTLVHDKGLTTVLTVAKGGTECDEHTSRQPTILISLAGKLAIRGASGAGTIQLPEGSAAALAPCVEHKLAAVTDCAYLTVIGSRP